MDSLNCDIIQGYGMSEGFLSLSTWKDSVYERINYQGKPMSDEDQVIIVDDDGKEQPYGIEGEILLKIHIYSLAIMKWIVLNALMPGWILSYWRLGIHYC